MKKGIIILAVLLAILPTRSIAQSDSVYKSLTEKAFAYYEGKEYLKSAKEYTKAFSIEGAEIKADDRYNAACSWALYGNVDSAIHNMSIAANELGYKNYVHMCIDPDLETVRSDKRWQSIVEKVKVTKNEQEFGSNKKLIDLLDSVVIEDQKYRYLSEVYEEKYGRDSKEMAELWNKVNMIDSLNVIKVTAIIDEHGWLGPEEIGYRGNQALFLVIQHADIETQMKYLPIMREAVKNKKARASSLALLEDRTSLRNGGKQIYGSQIGRDEDGTYYVLPLEDPEHVDERRAKVGLSSLNEYTQRWNFKWDVAAHKKRSTKKQ